MKTWVLQEWILAGMTAWEARPFLLVTEQVAKKKWGPSIDPPTLPNFSSSREPEADSEKRDPGRGDKDFSDTKKAKKG